MSRLDDFLGDKNWGHLLSVQIELGPAQCRLHGHALLVTEKLRLAGTTCQSRCDDTYSSAVDRFIVDLPQF